MCVCRGELSVSEAALSRAPCRPLGTSVAKPLFAAAAQVDWIALNRQRISTAGSVLQSLCLPRCQVFESTSVPPKRHASCPPALRDLAPQSQMRPMDLNYNV